MGRHFYGDRQTSKIRLDFARQLLSSKAEIYVFQQLESGYTCLKSYALDYKLALVVLKQAEKKFFSSSRSIDLHP